MGHNTLRGSRRSCRYGEKIAVDLVSRRVLHMTAGTFLQLLARWGTLLKPHLRIFLAEPYAEIAAYL